ncbi:hypothetical protein PoB_002149400 [Plakobranchus ocellatus]|uniref:Uncharacterized protein n=1 Tax=Plakobranchus ocellatus TaxID=259542 RepID=A0AAV3ZM95_9GAST|nr:hypothetical protein PoB_002149400 [Plakobranchus ocellatus]
MGQQHSRQGRNKHRQDMKQPAGDADISAINNLAPTGEFPSQAWPSWASGLTQRLPPEGDRGLFRGEFILMQGPSDQRSVQGRDTFTMGSNTNSLRRCK